MIDWTASMEQTFEYYIIDPITWKDSKKIDNIISSTIGRDESLETLGSASFELGGSIDECYVRTYLVANQNGQTYRFPLGTHMIQTPASSHNGKLSKMSADAYTPLIELKETQPPIGYYIEKNANIMEAVYALTSENLRAPVIEPICSETMFDHFVATPDETWLSYLSAAMTNANYGYSVNELGEILFAPKQEIETLQPIWTFTDDNSSILYPDVSIEHDLYGIPNAVEVVYSGDVCYYAKAINDDPSSPTSTVRRGRMITRRITDPSIVGDPTDGKIQEYARNALEALSSIEYSLTYTHGYCPVRVGDCVRLNYNRAGLKNIKARVKSQSIECRPGCKVTETATFTAKLWEG